MGLTSALSNSITGLNINQQQLDTLSQNISNANTAGYSNEVVNQQANFDVGQAAGVSVESISREINQYLVNAVQGQTSVNSAAATTQSYYSQLETLLGQPGSSSTLDQNIDTFFTDMQNLANSPSASAETTVVDAGQTLANQLSGLANSVENLRLQADNQVSDAVGNVNSDLKSLFNLNAAISQATASGQNTSGLLDQRDTLLSNISQYMGISTTYQTDGEVSVSTNGGTQLVGSQLGQLQYTPVSSVQTFINNSVLSPLTVETLNNQGQSVGTPAVLATGGTSANVTTSLTTGSIAALLQMRDAQLPDLLNQLDTLSSQIAQQVNKVSNSGTSFPPPNSYTGQQLVSANQTENYSGNLQIAVLGANGTPISSPYGDETNGLTPLNLNLSTLNYGQGNGVLSVNNIIDAVNQYYGPAQNKVEIGNLNNVQLQMAASTVPAVGNSLNFGFSLNNLTSTSANFYVSGVTVLDSNGSALASTASGGVVSTIPQIALADYQASGTNTVTVTTSGANSLTDGETVYISGGSGLAGTVGGVSASSIGGYYTVSGVSGNSFQITVNGVSGTGTAISAAAADAVPPYDTVDGGETVSTQSQGTFSASVGSSTSPYFTVEADIATVNSQGVVETSTVTYQVANNGTNVMNNVIGAKSATGAGTIVAPQNTQPIATAELVDASGNPLTTTNNSYGSQQGYLRITANNNSYTIALNQSGTAVGTSGQGVSQYYGLNNFFTVNNATAGATTVAGSALNMSVSSSLQENPGLISTGVLVRSSQPVNASSLPNYTYLLESGDNSVTQAMAGLASTNFTFAQAGDLPGTSTTFAQYAGAIISNVSTNSNNATTTATDAQTLLGGYTTAANNVSGVNLDQQLANTVVYQNSYTASARVISVIGTMFTSLMNIISG